jgi:phage-related protein
MAWVVETLGPAVDRELDVLPADMRARLVRVSDFIAAVGLPRVGMPHVRHVQGPIWEIRLKGATRIARALYVAVRHERVVILRVFVKKTERTPRREIEIALQRLKELK